jgi:hypothetical protein
VRRGLTLLAFAALGTLTSCGTNTTTTITKPATPSAVATTTTSTAVATTTTSTTTGDSYFQGAAGPALQRPRSLELTGDGTLYVSGAQWASWGGATASGTGIAHYHGCTPTCAQAPVTDALVGIRLFAIRTCAGRQYYSGLTLTLNSGGLLDKGFLEQSWSPC